jgi:hypothetical protein
MTKQQVTQNDIKETIDKIRQASITHTNFSQWYERYESKSEIIESNIASYTQEAKQLQKQIKQREQELQENELDYMDGSRDEKLEDMRKRFIEKQNEVVKWRNLQRKMESALLDSFNEALKAAKGLDIQKEVYNEFKNFHEEWMELMKDIESDYKNSLEDIATGYRNETKQEIRRLEVKQDQSLEVINNSMSEIANALTQVSESINRNVDNREEFKKELEKKLQIELNDDEQENLDKTPKTTKTDDFLDETDTSDDEEEKDDSDDLETEFEPVDDDIDDIAEEIDDTSETSDLEENANSQNESNDDLPPDSFLIDEYLDNTVKRSQDKIAQSNMSKNDVFLEKLLELETEGKDRKTVRNHIKDLLKS